MPPDAPAVFACTGCGDCCRWPGHVLLTDADIVRLAAALRLDERTFVERHTRLASNRAQLSLRETPDGACEFLSGNRCAIYAARPDQCRDFPRAWRVKGCRVEEGKDAENSTLQGSKKQEGRRGEVRTSCLLPYFDFPGRGAVRVPGHPRRMWSFRSGTGSAPGIPCGGRCRS